MRGPTWREAGLAGAAALAALLALLATGCSSVGYYAQSVGGHLALLRSARPVPQWLADPALPEDLRQRLALSPSPNWRCPTTPATAAMPTCSATPRCGTWWPRPSWA